MEITPAEKPWVIEHLDFDGLEALQESAAAAGFGAPDYVQLEAGQLTARTALLMCEEVAVLKQAGDRRLEATGEAPLGMTTVSLPLTPEAVRFNGRLLGPRDIAVFPAGAELQAIVTRPPIQSVSVHIPTEALERSAAIIGDDWQGFAPGRVTHVTHDAGVAFRDCVRSFLGDREDGFDEERVARLAECLVQISAGSPKPEARVLGRDRYLSDARSFIEANLGEPIRMSDLCRNVGASISTLERLFRRELEMTPVEYLRMKRLHSARRELIKNGPDGPSISRVARRYGFRHLGRFSIAFREQFGLLPSEARRARQ